MAVVIRQVTAGTAPLFLCTVPPGSFVQFATSATAASVAWGTSSAVTFASGAFLTPNASMEFSNPVNGDSFDVWVVTSTGTDAVSATVITNG